MKIVFWMKSHKLATLLLLVLLFFIGKNWLVNKPSYNSATMDYSVPSSGGSVGVSAPAMLRSGKIGGIIPPVQEAAPAPDVANRLVIQNSYISLLVSDVRASAQKIIDNAVSGGGYMVNSSIDNPGDATTATVTVRIPAKSLTAALEYIRSLGVRVVSENLTGQDVTDQYVDIDARMATLVKTKSKFEDILNQATKVEDILNVQREIINLESQIDSLKGQQQYLSQNAAMAKVTVYLSTDELALPYAPSEAWRPQVIFKEAVRSLVGQLRSIASSVIWLIVFSVIWIPALIILIVLYKKWGRKFLS
jgi:hypothetical protein